VDFPIEISGGRPGMAAGRQYQGNPRFYLISKDTCGMWAPFFSRL